MAKQLSSNAVSIYTDGSSLPAPRRGGTGMVFIREDEGGNEVLAEHSSLGWKGGNNQQMELQAAIEALDAILGRRPPVSLEGLNKIDIYSDSRYLVDNFGNAVFRWSTSGWKTRDGTPVANTEQWKKIVKLVRKAFRSGFRVEAHWVKGHKRDPFNKRADKLAKSSAKAGSDRILAPVRVRRRKGTLPTEPGNIPMTGQTASIYVVTDKYLPPPHNCYRYKYEIMDDDGEFRLPPDNAHSAEMISAGHYYRVRFNEDQRHPQIVEVIEELPRPGTEDQSNGLPDE